MDRSRLSVAAAFAAGLLIAMLLAVSPASALSCNNCVDATDLINDSIYNRHLTNGAVRSAEIADGQVYGSDIANGAVGAPDLAPNAKAAIGIVQLTKDGNIPAATTGVLDSFTVTVPPAASGYLLVRVDGVAYMDVNAPAADALTDNARLGLCTAASSMSNADCAPALQEIWTQDADSNNGFNETIAFTLQRVVAASPGTHTFYLNGTAGTAPLYLYGGPDFNGATATVQFFPSQFTVTS